MLNRPLAVMIEVDEYNATSEGIFFAAGDATLLLSTLQHSRVHIALAF